MTRMITAVLRKNDLASAISGYDFDDEGEHIWWFCLETIRQLWYIPESAKEFWLEASDKQMPGSYEMELKRMMHMGRLEYVLRYRLAGGCWDWLDENDGIKRAFDKFKVGEDPVTVHVRLLYR